MSIDEEAPATPPSGLSRGAQIDLLHLLRLVLKLDAATSSPGALAHPTTVIVEILTDLVLMGRQAAQSSGYRANQTPEAQLRRPIHPPDGTT